MRALKLSPILAVVLGVGCGSSDATSSGAFDIPDVVLHPSTAVCANNPSGSYSVDFSIHLVNTTASDVAVTKVGTQASITSSTVSSNEVGQGALVFSALTLVPSPMVVSAKTGDIRADAYMTAPCGPIPPSGSAVRKYSVTLLVTTAAGQQSFGPYALTVEWSSF